MLQAVGVWLHHHFGSISILVVLVSSSYSWGATVFDSFPVARFCVPSGSFKGQFLQLLAPHYKISHPIAVCNIYDNMRNSQRSIRNNFHHTKLNIRFSTTIKTRQYLYRVHKNNPAISYTFSDHCNMGFTTQS